MIERAEVEAIALALPEATRVVLFRDRVDIYKVRGKVFGVCDGHGLSFKASEIAYAVLTEGGPGRKAPGFPPGRWVEMPLSELDPGEAADWLAASWRTVAGGLTKKAQAELGIAG
jgi:predicted DNA-binding protein (MmcQ/YjbR family)